MKNTTLVLCILFLNYASAQTTTLNGKGSERIQIPYPYQREADVLWSKKVWRNIDLTEKINAPLRYPLMNESIERRSFITIVMNAIKDGRLLPYRTDDDEFTYPLTTSEVARIGSGDTMRIAMVDPNPPYIERDTSIVREFNYDDVVMLRLKEVCFFDKQRSATEVRIIGVCLIAQARDAEGNLIEGGQKKPLFWLYFPELRSVLIKEKVFNRFNSTQQLTFDDLFMKRMFSSYIMKEDNVYNRRIDDYKLNPLDALLESERVKQDMVNFEHDLWEY